VYSPFISDPGHSKSDKKINFYDACGWQLITQPGKLTTEGVENSTEKEI